MAERRKILELDLDIDRLIKAAGIAKRDIDKLKKAQKGLNLETAEGRKQFARNESNIKKAQANYRNYQKALVAVGESTTSFNQIQTRVNSLLRKSTVSVGGARESNQKLLEIRNRLNLSTERGRKQLDRINKKIDQNNAFIKKNVSGQEKLKIGIGGYEQAITSALGRTNLFGVNLGSLTRTLYTTKRGIDAKKAATIQATGATTGLSASLVRLKLALISTGIGAIIVALGTFAVLTTGVIKKSAEFAKSQSNLKAVLQATDEDMRSLSRNAVELGSRTAFTATQVSQLQTEFAKLGFTKDQILAVTEATLDLAAAAGTDLADAAIVAGNTLNGFDLRANETARVADVMSLSFSNSALDIEKFRESMKTVAPEANTANVSIEQTTASLAILADRGIAGSIAGTKLRKTISELVVTTGKTYRDALDEVAQKLNATEEASEKLAIANDYVGERARGALIVLAENRQELDELTKAYENAEGASKAIAEVKLDNLQGDATKLSSAWEGFILNLEDGQGVLTKIARGGVQLLTKAIQGITNASTEWSFLWSNTTYNVSEQTSVLVERLKISFSRLGANVSIFANKAKIAISNIPIIGSSIDIGKAAKNIQEAEALLVSSSARIEAASDRQDKLNERYATTYARLLEFKAGEEAKTNEALKKKIQEQNDEAAKTATEASIKESQTRLQILIEENSQKGKTYQEEVDLADNVRQRKLAILKSQLQAEKITQAEYDLGAIQAKNEFNQKVEELDKEKADREDQFLEKRRELKDQIELAQAESDLEKAILKAEQDFVKQELELENLQLNEEQKIELLALLETQKEEVLSGIRTSYAEKDLKEREKLEKKRKSIRDKAFNDAVRLVGEETKLGKALLAIKQIIALREQIIESRRTASKGATAIANTTVAGAEGAAQTAKVGFPQNIPLLLGYAVQIGGIISAVRSAVSSSKSQKFQDGGVIDIGGKDHSQGGTKFYGDDGTRFEAQKGEKMFILNRRASQRIGEYLSHINQKYGGVALTNKRSYLQAGGQVSRGGNTVVNQAPIDYDLMATKVGDVVSEQINNVKIVAIESDITDAQAARVEIEEAANG